MYTSSCSLPGWLLARSVSRIVYATLPVGHGVKVVVNKSNEQIKLWAESG